MQIGDNWLRVDARENTVHENVVKNAVLHITEVAENSYASSGTVCAISKEPKVPNVEPVSVRLDLKNINIADGVNYRPLPVRSVDVTVQRPRQGARNRVVSRGNNPDLSGLANGIKESLESGRVVLSIGYISENLGICRGHEISLRGAACAR